MSILIPENGDGVEGANVYVVDIAEAKNRLRSLGFPEALSAFSALADDERREAVLVYGAGSVEAYLVGASTLGPARRPGVQGLFFPRDRQIRLTWVPREAIDASLLFAEARAVEQSGRLGEVFGEVPANVTAVTLADGVEVRKTATTSRDPASAELRHRARKMLDSLFEWRAP